MEGDLEIKDSEYDVKVVNLINLENILKHNKDRKYRYCLLYTSPSPRDGLLSRMPSSA